jgi:hypothetical protein
MSSPATRFTMLNRLRPRATVAEPSLGTAVRPGASGPPAQLAVQLSEPVRSHAHHPAVAAAIARLSLGFAAAWCRRPSRRRPPSPSAPTVSPAP